MTRSKEVWGILYQNTKGLQQAHLGDRMFSNEDIVELQDLVKSIINKFLQSEELLKGIKIYVDRELDNDVIYKMANRPIDDNESIEA